MGLRGTWCSQDLQYTTQLIWIALTWQVKRMTGMLRKMPGSPWAWSASQKARCLEDFQNHLLNLQESLATGECRTVHRLCPVGPGHDGLTATAGKIPGRSLDALRDVLREESLPISVKKPLNV